ncbi:unnamed protein product [Lactuca virosa]|uniref:SHSP domain-containing protein n=1 Tax=Lactuca virosa TaxID=75947 RepID=A0AAU9PHT2_9ASTR|nr:unnamed protein product [Lactuca virosa]
MSKEATRTSSFSFPLFRSFQKPLLLPPLSPLSLYPINPTSQCSIHHPAITKYLNSYWYLPTLLQFWENIINKVRNGYQSDGFDITFFRNLHHIIEATDDTTTNNKSSNAGPTGANVRDARAMAATPADVKVYPNSYVFIVDMPGLKSGDIKVQVEEDNVLVRKE